MRLAVVVNSTATAMRSATVIMTSRDRKLNLTHVSIQGYRSIQSLDRLPLKNINILIGANGVGKSNFIDFVKLFSELAAIKYHHLNKSDVDISTFDNDIRSADKFVYFKGDSDANVLVASLENDVGIFKSVSPKGTNEGAVFVISIKDFRANSEYANDSPRMVDGEKVNQDDISFAETMAASIQMLKSLGESTVFNFHNIRETIAYTTDTTKPSELALAANGANFAKFLEHIKQKNPLRYEKILGIIQMAAPFFDDFIFETDEEIKAQFQWKQKGVERYFHPQQLSESTLRFICLTAALLQPDPPALLVFDEPELGLHPMAVHLLSELIHMASDDAQIIAATQSSVLVDYFEPDDIIVVERVDGASRFKRLCNKELEPWLEKYSLGDLWRKNNIGGGPWGA